MPTLRDRLIERYSEHYARVNADIDPAKLAPSRTSYMKVMYDEFVANLPDGSRILDLGCGSGMLVAWLATYPNLRPEGVDQSSSQVEIANRSLPQLPISCQDGLEFVREHRDTYQGIFCTDVLEHIPGKDECLEVVDAAREALTPGGFFFCRMPNAASILGAFTRYRDLTHECSFTSDSILQLLEAAGLENCRVVPVRVPSLGGRARQAVEHVFHKILYRVCGETIEEVMTTNVCAIGYRSKDD